MSISILFASSYTDLGGGETALLNLVDTLDPARYRPHLLVPRAGQLSAAWEARGWPVHILPYRGATVYFVPAVWARLPVTRRIERLIRDQDIRLVHSDYHTLPMALPAADRCGVPTLWTCWGWWFRPKPWQRGFFRRCAAILAQSRAILEGFLGDPPFMPPDRIEILYPGVDTARFHPGVDGNALRAEIGVEPAALVVALIARFQDVKGHDVFQAMARRIAAVLPEARFIVAGENTQTRADDVYKRGILQAARTDPLLRDRLLYLGYRADVERVIAAADVVVCSSHFESFGMVNIEAMACGRPVVSTNRGGPSETVVHGETGLLVAPGDPDGLAAAALALLRDPARRAQMGAAGRARVERLFSAESSGARFAQVIEAALAARR